MHRQSIAAHLAALALGLTLLNAQAVECLDPGLTRAIKEATGRAPKAGECNPKLYAQADTHEARVDAVRKTLSQLADRGRLSVPTQKLPLRPAEGGARR